MAGINNLRQVKKKKGKDFLDNILNNFVVINENIDGTFFGVKKDPHTDKFKYFKKSGEITYVDRVLMKFYNPAIAYFENMPENKRQRIPSNFYFGFQYITRKDVNRSNLKREPKNGLILSYIHRLSEDGKPEETLQTRDSLERWAYFLGVEAPPIIFEGKLDDEQKSAVLDFAYADEESLSEKFKTTSFTKYVISVLSKEDEDREYINLGNEIDSIVFRFYDENDENPKENVFLAKIVDPIFKEDSKGNVKSEKSTSNDYIWLILIDLMNHIEIYDDNQLREICGDVEDYDLRYLKLMNEIFKSFIDKYSFKYEGLELDTPDYLKRPEFEIEYDLIGDDKILNLVKSSDTFKEIYRILINFFRKVRKKSTSSFFDHKLLNQLNIQIKKIKRIIMGDVVYEGLFPSFGEFIGDSNLDSLYINEQDVVVKSKSVKSKPEEVNILIGQFQPIHNGHIKAAEALKAKNGLPCVFISIFKSNRKYPFSERSIRVMLEKTQQSNPDLIKDIVIANRNSINDILKSLKPRFNPNLWGSSEKKIKDYALQLEFIRKKNIPLRITDTFKLIEVPKYQKTQDVLDAIRSGNYSKFKNMVPSSIASEFFNMQKELEFYDEI
jgi:hypothetical protein